MVPTVHACTNRVLHRKLLIMMRCDEKAIANVHVLHDVKPPYLILGACARGLQHSLCVCVRVCVCVKSLLTLFQVFTIK